ncbi:MAG TPA: hypothetical protein P5260_19545 [Candidatus Competibacter sp.]|nr:hypothetical protein [Candidatus Competibacter sp.]
MKIWLMDRRVRVALVGGVLGFNNQPDFTEILSEAGQRKVAVGAKMPIATANYPLGHGHDRLITVPAAQ